jgi:UPF0271 protein
MTTKVDVNCDLGESYGHFKVGCDAEIMPHITSANIACGFHAGDPAVMAKTVWLAKKNGVAVGAHPGFPDLAGFGRRFMELSKEEVTNIVLYQIGALGIFARGAGVGVQHVKPHGALYNAAAETEPYARGMIDAVLASNSRAVLFALAGSRLARMAEKEGLRVAHEVFIDRAYRPDGSLVSRAVPGSLIGDARLAVRRAVRIVKEKKVTAIDGRDVELGEVHTICVHGDAPNAVALAGSLKKALLAARVEVLPAGLLV